MLNIRLRFNLPFFLRQLVALALLFILQGAYAQQPPPPSGAYDAAPYLGEVRNTYVYGDIWERPNLSKRDRSMITNATFLQFLWITMNLEDRSDVFRLPARCVSYRSGFLFLSFR